MLPVWERGRDSQYCGEGCIDMTLPVPLLLQFLLFNGIKYYMYVCVFINQLRLHYEPYPIIIHITLSRLN
jgi:hypothetical protein